MAIAFVGAMYLPARWGWLVGPVALVITDLAFLRVNYLTDGSGSMFSLWTLASLGIYAAAGGLGVLLSHHKSLGKVIIGSLGCSLLFYVVANTFSWVHNISIQMTPGYAGTLAGWWQANTVGLPGYVPTWLFLRNAMVGDLFFAMVLLLILDRHFLFGRVSDRSTASVASNTA